MIGNTGMSGAAKPPVMSWGARRVLGRLRRLLFPPPPEPTVGVHERPPFTLTQGSVQPDEAVFLKRLVELANGLDGPIIEVGALFGMTTIRLAQWKRPGKPLLAVDNFAWNPLQLTPAEHLELTRGVLGYLLAIGEVSIVQQGKNEFYESYSGPPPALVFLDAIHTYEETKLDIEWALRAGAQLISGHDYSPDFPGVVQAVEECGGLRERGGTVWLLSRP
ncbi:MAG: hypothetical protein ACK6CT_07220 [Planctomycetia bacterium]|jgi:hypothetical protein